jgi:dolichol kinase
MNPEKKFDHFFKKELNDLLPPLERERKKSAVKGTWGYVLLVLAAIFFFASENSTLAVFFSFIFFVKTHIFLVVF